MLYIRLLRVNKNFLLTCYLGYSNDANRVSQCMVLYREQFRCWIHHTLSSKQLDVPSYTCACIDLPFQSPTWNLKDFWPPEIEQSQK